MCLSGKAFWLVITVLGLCAALAQCVMVVQQYLEDQANVLQVTEPKPVQDLDLNHMQYLTVCHRSWLDQSKVEEQRVKYTHVLFALSLIASLDEYILDEMEQQWNISDQDRIWGLKPSSCLVPATTTTQAPTPSPTEAGSIIGGVLGAAGEVVETAGEVVGGVVSGVGSLVGDVVGGLTQVVGGLTVSLLGTDGKINKEGLAKLSDSELDHFLASLNETTRGMFADAVREEMCVSCKRNLTVMDDWATHSQAFYEEMKNFETTTNDKVPTLTHFLASIAKETPEVTARLGKRVGWTIAMGQLCEVVQVSASSKAMRVKGESIKLDVPLRLGSLDGLLTAAQDTLDSGSLRLQPYFMDSVYDEDVSREIGSDKLQKAMDGVTQLGSLIGAIASGTRLVANLRMPKVTKISRSRNCIPVPQTNGRYPKDSAKIRCERECLKAAEQTTANYTIVTGNNMGDIPLHLGKLLPERIVENFTVDYEQAAKCAVGRKCATQYYCEEWEYSDIDVTSKTVPLTCEDDHREQTIGLEIEMVRGYEVTDTSQMSIVDLIGLIGGMLGLYMGASLVTIFHAAAFLMGKAVNKVQRM